MSLLTLLRRQLAARLWPTLLLALTLALLAGLAASIPRFTGDLDDRQLSQRLSSLSAIQGDVSGSWTPRLNLSAEVVDPWPGYRDAAEAIRYAEPQPLASLLSPAQFVARFATTVAFVPPTDSGYYRVTASLLVDPDLAAHTQLVEGAWPGVVTEEGGRLQVAILDSLADRMGWGVGAPIGDYFTVSGTFRPVDADDPRWQHIELGRRYNELNDPNLGLELEAGLFLAPQVAGGDPTMLLQAPFTFTLWYRVDAGQVGSEGLDVGELNAQLTGLLAGPHPLQPLAEDAPAGEEVRLTSELGTALSSVQAQQRTTRTLIAVSAAGPLGVGMALVVLASQLVMERRRSALALLLARGMSTRQLRRLNAAEGLVVGVPAAVAGHLLAAAWTPGSTPWASWVVTGALAAVPALTLAWSGRRAVSDPSREAPTARRWRLVGELLVYALAAAGTWRMLSAGAAGVGEGVDLLGVATPVLLAGAACLAALRAYPLPLRLLHRRLRSGPGLTGFLGSARALRNPAGGRIPVVTVVLGTTMAVLSAVLLGTVSAGTERAAWDANGSSVHVSGPVITDELADQLRALDGVTAVARVRDAGSNVALTSGSTTTRVRLWLADADLPAAYAVAFGGSPVPRSLFDDGEPAAVVLGGDTPQAREADLAPLGGVRVVAHLGGLPGVEPGASWVLADAARWEGSLPRATLALVSVADGVSADAVAAQVEELAPNARVSTITAQLEALRDSPTISGLTGLLTVLGISTAGLMLLAIFASQLMASQSRRALAAVLRTSGLPRRQLRALTAWELGPVVAVSLVLGVALGIAIAALLLHAVDFAALTGGAAQPRLYLDPALMGAVVGGLTLATGVAVLVSAALASRTNVAEELRIGEER